MQVPQPGPAAAAQAPADEGTGAEEAAAIEVGARCEVEGGRRGVVRYVGRVEGLPLGWWVGVQVRAGWGGRASDFSLRTSDEGGKPRPPCLVASSVAKPHEQLFREKWACFTPNIPGMLMWPGPCS